MRSRFFAVALALILTGCREAIATNSVSLPLIVVDNVALPVTLATATGSIQVTGGRLVGSRYQLGCTWTVNLSNGTNPSGTLTNCLLSNPLDVVNLTLDLSASNGPTGTHIYTYGVGQ